MPQIRDTVLIFCMLLPGLALFIIGIYNYRKMRRLKEIAHFPLLNEDKTFSIPKPGRYYIIVVGGSKIKNLPLKLVSLTNEDVEGSDIFPAARTMHKGGIGVAYCEFYIDNPGKYSIIIKNYDMISVQHYKVGPLALLPHSDIPNGRLSLIVKEYTPPITFFLALMGTLIGLFLVMGSICFLLYNHGIVTPSESETTTTTTYTL